MKETIADRRIRHKAYRRERTCDVCKKVESVHRTSRATTCKRCSWDRVGLIQRGTRHADSRQVDILCNQCLKPFNVCDVTAHKRKFCSKSCSLAYKTINRICRMCEAPFVAYASASGRAFCKASCYHRWLCRTDRRPRYGTRWEAIRKEVKRKSPFCALCGTMKRIHVHHIIPFRLTFDNDPSNLIPLCAKHHKKVEGEFLKLESIVAGDLVMAKNIISLWLREEQQCTRMILNRIAAQIRAERLSSTQKQEHG